MIFVTGGARSGKSSFAEKLAAGRGPKVTYLATAAAGDTEMRKRIESHRQRRPSDWQTVEVGSDLAGAVGQALEGGGAVLVDCITVYLAGLMLQETDGTAGGAEGDMQGNDVGDDAGGGSACDSGRSDDSSAAEEEIEHLVEVCRSGNGRVIIVGNEVGMGIVPASPLGRAFRDVAGRANQKLAAAADEVYLCVSGIPLKVK